MPPAPQTKRRGWNRSIGWRFALIDSDLTGMRAKRGYEFCTNFRKPGTPMVSSQRTGCTRIRRSANRSNNLNRRPGLLRNPRSMIPETTAILGFIANRSPFMLSPRVWRLDWISRLIGPEMMSCFGENRFFSQVRMKITNKSFRYLEPCPLFAVLRATCSVRLGGSAGS